MPTKFSTRFTAQIQTPPERIFDLVADLPNYGLWLPDSPVFAGIVEVTPYPVRLGTTYVDAGPVQKSGTITEYDPPNHISFQHTMHVRQSPLNTDIEAGIRYTFDPKDAGTFVERNLTLTFHLSGVLHLGLPRLLHSFRKENDRILVALKQYAERPA